MIGKLICRLFGHRKPYLVTPDKMRWACSRCGYATYSLFAFNKWMGTDISSRLLREGYNNLSEFKQFKEVRKLFTTE